MSNYSNTNHDLSKQELLFKIKKLEESNKQLSEENQKLKDILTTKLGKKEQEKEREFQAIIETIPASIVISTIKGEILFINQKASETFGVAKNSIKEYNTGDFYGNFGDRPKIIKLFQQQGFVKNYQVKVKTNQGKYFWANVNIYPCNYQKEKVLLSVLLDITELKKITQQKEKLINQYLDILYLFNFSLDLLCIANFDGYFVQLNPAWETVLGYSLNELVKIPYLSLVHPEDREKTIKEAEKISQGFNTIKFENRYLCKDGSYRWFLWMATPVMETRLIYCVVHDITEAKINENKLRQSREEMQLITNSLPISISYIDNQRRYLFVNQTHETWFNHQKTQVIGKYIWEILGREFYEQKAKSYIDQVLQGEEIKYESEITFFDGKIRYIEVNLVPDYDINKEVRGYFCLFTDISDRRQQEELLRVAKDNYQKIFENASEGIFQSTFEGKYLKVNPALAKIHGYSSPAEMITKITNIATQIYVDANQRKEFQTLIGKNGEVKNFQYQAYQKNGVKIWLEENTRAVYNSQGELLHYEGIVQDITKRKEKEQLLQQELKRLRIEIDQNEKNNLLNQVTKSNYFQKIKSDIDQLRPKR